MGRILNTPAKRRVLTSPSTLDKKSLAKCRYKIKLDVSRSVDDIASIMASNDRILKAFVDEQLARIQVRPSKDSKVEDDPAGAADDSTEIVEAETLDLGDYLD